MMKIPKMGEEDLQYNFIDGIKAWAELELEDRKRDFDSHYKTIA